MRKKISPVSLAIVFIPYILACSQPESIGESTGSPEMQEAGFSTPRSVKENPSSLPLSPEESLQSFRLPEGYRLELVACEPMVSEPVAITWDGNGRMYVAQMETYMQSIDAKDQNQPYSRIMVLEDTDQDGNMDKSSVFLDSLVLPRMILCVGREVLVNETHTYDMYAYSDNNGDGTADQKRTVFQTDEKAYGNVEHQRSGLDWNLDNWIYVTIDPVRFRYKEGLLLVDSLINGSNGQWGLTHDNYGRLYFSRAAAGLAATGFQINPVYGQLELEDAFDSTFHMVWPIVKTPDVNGGPKTLRQDSTLLRFTSVAGQSVFRGDRLPSSMQGNYIAAEPVGRLIRRAVISENEGQIKLQNKYREEEFISSDDLNFRPINTYTGPDGCLYIVDMYRGIIQESTWAQPGGFLYSQIMGKGLDKNVKNGRIYRLVHKDYKPGPKPNMLNESSQQLLTYLDHPNGWWRDNAQKELIVRMDTTVIPELRQIIREDPPSSLERLHALWTLEGLEGINQQILVSAMEDEDPQVRKAAIRISETYLMKNDQQILKKMETMEGDNSEEVHQQMVLSLPFSSSDQATTLHNKLKVNAENKVMAGILSTQEKNKEAEKYGSKLVSLSPEDREMVIKGSAIFKSLCVSCHGPEGKGLPTKLAPPLISKFRLIEQKEGLVKIMLHGLKGPLEGENYADIMPAMGANDDLWIASVLNYVRFDLSMKSFPQMPPSYLEWVIIKPDQVKAVREKHKSRNEPWTWEEIINPS